jgi:hypothetical protein
LDSSLQRTVFGELKKIPDPTRGDLFVDFLLSLMIPGHVKTMKKQEVLNSYVKEKKRKMKKKGLFTFSSNREDLFSC